MGLQGLHHCQTVVCNGRRGHHQGVLEEDRGCGGREQWQEEWKRKEEEIKVEFGLVVEELWGRVARRWEESEWRQEQRWAAMTATLECIADNV